MYKGTLTKLNTKTENHNLRTDNVEGIFEDLPAIGQGFLLIGESLTPEKDSRLVTTSIIKEIMIKDKNKMKFQTLNSTYELDYLFVGLEN